jgi:two-component system nitrogen regulation sensor histidine kinase GlnL
MAQLPPIPTPDFEGLLEALVDGFVVLDGQGRILRLNSEASRIFETSSELAVDRTIDDVLGEGHPLERLVAQVLETKRPAVQDGIPVVRRHGDALEVSVSLSPIDGEIEGASIVGVLRDRTMFNQLREQFSNAELLVSYGHIAAGIAHEVKNPLGGIRGAAELLGLWAGEDERAHRTAEMIVREVDRITGLVEELMVFARGDRLELSTVNVHRLIDEVIQNAELDAAAESVEFDRLYDPSIPEIEADAARLTQVFLNLVRNSIQAMEDADTAVRRLTIVTRMPLDHRLTGLNGRAIPTVQISLRDTGPGIEPEVLARLATPFFTTKAKGTGLGLAVSRHWIARHGGRLRIESEQGAGTSIHVDLPLQAQIQPEHSDAHGAEGEREKRPDADEPDVGSPRARHHGV